MEKQRFPYQLKGRRCPCCCGGEGALVFIVCPNCSHLKLVCDEVGTVYSDLGNPQGDNGASWLGHRPEVNRCPVCLEVPFRDFRYASEAQLLGAGLDRTRFEENPFPIDEET